MNKKRSDFLFKSRIIEGKYYTMDGKTEVFDPEYKKHSFLKDLSEEELGYLLEVHERMRNAQAAIIKCLKPIFKALEDWT